MSDIFAGYIPAYGNGKSLYQQDFDLGIPGYNPQQGLGRIDAMMKQNGISTEDGATNQIGSFSDTLGLNIPTLQLGLSGLNSLGNIYGAFQANKLANTQFDYAKKVTDTNLANSIKSYNTTLSDRANARASVEGWSDQQTQDYVNKNKL